MLRMELKDYLEDYCKFLLNCLVEDIDESLLKVTEELSKDIHKAYENRRTIFVCGNGGSGSNASHFCEDLGKIGATTNYEKCAVMKRLRVLSNRPHLELMAKSCEYDKIFTVQLRNLAEPNDILIAISADGNDINIIDAVNWANDRGLITWGITGFNGGVLKKISKKTLHVPHKDTGIVESTHFLIFHWIVGNVCALVVNEEE